MVEGRAGPGAGGWRLSPVASTDIASGSEWLAGEAARPGQARARQGRATQPLQQPPT